MNPTHYQIWLCVSSLWAKLQLSQQDSSVNQPLRKSSKQKGCARNLPKNGCEVAACVVSGSEWQRARHTHTLHLTRKLRINGRLAKLKSLDATTVLVSHRDKEATVAHERAPIYFRVFHLYKQKSSDNRDARAWPALCCCACLSFVSKA